MRCEHCDNVGDWIGDDSAWSPIHDDFAACRPLVECADCGHRQRIA